MPDRVTFCRICEASCGLIAEVEDGRVRALRPDPDHVLSRGFACNKGVHYTAIHDSPDRVRTPLKRVGDRFESIGWEQALREIGDKVRALRAAHGADSVGMYIGNPTAFSVPHIAFAGMFVHALRTRHLYTSGSQDCNNKFVAAEEMFGSPLLQPVPDLDRLRCFIVVGANPSVSQMTFVNAPRIHERLKAMVARGGRLFFVNPRRTESASSGEQVFIRPGSDVFFFLAFARELFVRGACSARVLGFVSGVEALRGVVMPWTPERCAPLSGISAEQLRAMVSAYLAADGAALYAGTGVNQGPHGTLCLWLLHAINVLSGNFDRRGGMLMTAQQVRTAKHGYPSGEAITHKRSRIGGHRSVMDSMPAAILADEIETPGPGQLRAMFVTAGNPALSCPNGERLQAALSRLELLVCVDLFRNETGELAHYVLPTTSFLERSDMPMGVAGYQPVPYLQWADKVVEPEGDVRDEWWIFTRLAGACGVPARGSRLLQGMLELSTRARWPRALRFSPDLIFSALAAMERHSLRSLRKRPHGVLLPEPRAGRFLGRAPTRDGKIALAPRRFVEAAQELEAFAQRMQERRSLQLITKRERNSHNSWMHNVPRFVEGARGTNYLYMHPQDAAGRALADGARCRVRTEVGVLEVELKLSDDLMPGTVALPHGWGHQRAQGLTTARKTRGVNANLLAMDGPQSVEVLSGMARLTALEVEVEALG
jgi:anaerobic selenocysteine-containing dehydrogenase